MTGLRFILLILLAAASPLKASDGYELWLGHPPLSESEIQGVAEGLRALCAPSRGALQQTARREILEATERMLGSALAPVETVDQEGVLVLGTPESSSIIAGLDLADDLETLSEEGFLIRRLEVDGHPAIVIASAGDRGVLYGTFAFLRHLQVHRSLDKLDRMESPRFRLRLLNHWDNLDGSVERGYAGRSLWDWEELPEVTDPRLADYARANASIGLNGSVLNNVNASARSLEPEYLHKAAAIAGEFRPYGIRVFLSARFSAPMELGGLSTADPLDEKVSAWWKRKAEEIYRIIPDFGGFLVKANSEGQPGPLTYGRSHADGANMLAAALEPHGGIVMWRAFVYEPDDSDRIAQSFDAMKPLDGAFASNVLLQVKNGPLDFRPREPFHPLFGGMRRTQVMPELQITQEYLGHSWQLAFLGPMWTEFLNADTHARGPGSTVARTVDGSLFRHDLTGIAGVANTGSDRNWTGHPLAQANWYAFGRLAWDPGLSSEQIAREWIAMTLTRDPEAAAIIERLLLESREAVVDYSMPLGLTHLMWEGHHYGPQPWCDHLGRPDWNPTYFHRADEEGIGFDRTKTGSNAVAQYHPAVRERFGNLETCPEEYLLWFHRVPWDHEMKSGRTLWEELTRHYQRGVNWVAQARESWTELEGVIDPEIHAEVTRRLAIQERDAIRWRDACQLYFGTLSGLPLPEGVGPIRSDLDELKKSDPLDRR